MINVLSFNFIAVQLDEITGAQKTETSNVDEFNQLFNEENENVVLKALDGFVIVLSTDGDVVFVSENVHDFLGIQQVKIGIKSMRSSLRS